MLWKRILILAAYLLVCFFPSSSLVAFDKQRTCLSPSQAQSLFSLVTDGLKQGSTMIAVDTPYGARWMSPSRYVAKLLNMNMQPQLIFDEQELRFLPYTLPGTHVLLVTELVSLSEVQLSKVLAVASQFDLVISLLTLERPSEPVADLIKRSGGKLYDSQSILHRICKEDLPIPIL